MSYQLPDELERRIKARLANDKYTTEDDVIRDALDALDQLEQETLRRWHEGNAIAIEQSRRGLSKPLDDDEVLGRLENRLKKEGLCD